MLKPTIERSRSVAPVSSLRCSCLRVLLFAVLLISLVVTNALPPHGVTEQLPLTHTPLRIALTFHGVFRALPHTIPSIRANLIAPLEEAASLGLDVFLHVLHTSRLTDKRAEEDFVLDPFAFLAFNATERLRAFAVEDQTVVDTDHNLTGRAKVEWEDRRNHALLRYHFYTTSSFLNIFRGTYSLFAVSKLVRAHEQNAGFEYTHLCFARPDIRIAGAFRWRDFPFNHGDAVMTANTHHFAGLNDRFAFGTRDAMFHLAAQFPAEERRRQLPGLNSEKRRAAHLATFEPKVTVAFTPICLVRVRSRGGALQRDLHAGPERMRRFAGLIRLTRSDIDNIKPCDRALVGARNPPTHTSPRRPPSPPPPSPPPPSPPASFSAASSILAMHHPSFQLLSTSGMCRTDDKNKGNFDEIWGMRYLPCHDMCLYSLGYTGFEYAVEGKASRCKLFKGPILSTLPVGGARCYKKASKTELGPHKKRL